MSEDGLKKVYRITLIIGIAMLSSLLIYAGIVGFMMYNYRPFKGFSPFSNIDILRYILFGIALSEFFFITVLRKVILSGKLLSESSEGQKPLYSPDAQKLMRSSIITLALCESVAIYGLILFIMNGSVLDFLGLFVLSLIYFSVFFPRYSQWQDWIKKTGHDNVAEEEENAP